VPDSFVEFPLERAHHLARWQELVDDPELARWPSRVETDRLGRMIVSLIPALSHSFRQGDIFRALCDLLPGEALFACPLVTLDGVKVIDVVWIGPEYAARLESAKSSGFGARSGNLCRSAFTVQLQARNGREARPLL
jgi:hypothetical protein